MTRKDYIKAAQKLVALNLPDKARSEAAAVLASVFEQDNPRFDRTRFFEACNATGFGSGL